MKVKSTITDYLSKGSDRVKDDNAYGRDLAVVSARDYKGDWKSMLAFVNKMGKETGFTVTAEQGEKGWLMVKVSK